MKANTFLGLVAGLAAGAVLGVLFAPEKGEENRKKVKKMAEDCLEKVKCAIDPDSEEEEEEAEEAPVEPEENE